MEHHGISRGVLLPLLALCLAACSSQKPFKWTAVERGEVMTPGVVIQAADGSFTLRAGQPFVPPMPATNCPTSPAPRNWDTVKANATKVIVHHPAASAPVHGLLVFCSVPPNNEPQGQLHTLKISEDRLPQTATMESVVWDDVAYDWEYRDDAGDMSQVSSWPTWILWMSQQPL